jgi:hypothetical protein
MIFLEARRQGRAGENANRECPRGDKLKAERAVGLLNFAGREGKVM